MRRSACWVSRAGIRSPVTTSTRSRDGSRPVTSGGLPEYIAAGSSPGRRPSAPATRAAGRPPGIGVLPGGDTEAVGPGVALVDDVDAPGAAALEHPPVASAATIASRRPPFMGRRWYAACQR